jgi:hypothetical protein
MRLRLRKFSFLIEDPPVKRGLETGHLTQPYAGAITRELLLNDNSFIDAAEVRQSIRSRRTTPVNGRRTRTGAPESAEPIIVLYSSQFPGNRLVPGVEAIPARTSLCRRTAEKSSSLIITIITRQFVGVEVKSSLCRWHANLFLPRRQESTESLYSCGVEIADRNR